VAASWPTGIAANDRNAKTVGRLSSRGPQRGLCTAGSPGASEHAAAVPVPAAASEQFEGINVPRKHHAATCRFSLRVGPEVHLELARIAEALGSAIQTVINQMIRERLSDYSAKANEIASHLDSLRSHVDPADHGLFAGELALLAQLMHDNFDMMTIRRIATLMVERNGERMKPTDPCAISATLLAWQK
jgi:hypothetical protein